MTYEQNVRAILESNFAGSKDEIVDIAVRNIVTLTENKGEWIPTIERLPEIGDTVLCSVKTPECIDHHIIICKYCAEEFWKDGTIRAWQPLPEPYKERGE